MIQSIRTEYSQLIAFIRKPSSDVEPPANKLLTFCFAFCLDVCVSVIFLLLYWVIILLELDKYIVETDLMADDSKIRDFLFMCIIAPLGEEFIFRLPLKYTGNQHLKNLIWPYSLVLLFVSIFLKDVPPYTHILFWLLLWVLPMMAIFFFKDRASKMLEKFFTNHFSHIFWVSCLLFAVIHLSNYHINRYVILFAPILVGSQFMGGILLGYIRLKNGFWWGVLGHSAFNGVVFLCMYYLPT